MEDTNGVRYYGNRTRMAKIISPDVNKPETLVALIHKDITGESASAAIAREMYEEALAINETSVELSRTKIFQIVLNKTSKQLEHVIDLVSAYHSLYGTFFDSFIEFETIMEQWLPQFRLDAVGSLRRFIEEELYSLKYEILFGQLMLLEDGEDSANTLLQNRSIYVNRHFYNKFSKYPSLIQRTQALSKLSALEYGGKKVDLIFKLSKEELTPPFNQQFIDFTESYRDNLYRNVALVFSLFRENLDVDSDEFDLSNYLAGLRNLSSSQVHSKIINDPFFTGRAELLAVEEEEELAEPKVGISIQSQSSTTASSWKSIEGIGILNDSKFPWIFHLDLGWLYSFEPANEYNLWFYSDSLMMGEEKIGWFWTSKEIFEMPSSQ